MYSGGIRTSQEASEIIMKHQEGLGKTRQALQGEQTRQGDQAGQGDQPRHWRQALQKEQAGQGYQAEQGHQPWLGGGPSKKSRLGRESRLSKETSLWWEGKLCRESWLGIAYSNRFIYHFNPTFSPPPLNLLDDFWSFLVGEWCKIFQSRQLQFTALHGLPCLHCCCSFSDPCFKTVDHKAVCRTATATPGLLTTLTEQETRSNRLWVFCFTKLNNLFKSFKDPTLFYPYWAFKSRFRCLSLFKIGIHISLKQSVWADLSWNSFRKRIPSICFGPNHSGKKFWRTFFNICRFLD